MSQWKVQPKTISDVLIHEVSGQWSVDRVTLSGAAFELGQVVAKVGDKYVPLAPGAGDASAQAVGVVMAATDAAVADRIGPVWTRGVVLFASGLIWPANVTPVQKTTAIVDLTKHGIVVRAS